MKPINDLSADELRREMLDDLPDELYPDPGARFVARQWRKQNAISPAIFETGLRSQT